SDHPYIVRVVAVSCCHSACWVFCESCVCEISSCVTSSHFVFSLHQTAEPRWSSVGNLPRAYRATYYARVADCVRVPGGGVAIGEPHVSHVGKRFVSAVYERCPVVQTVAPVIAFDICSVLPG